MQSKFSSAIKGLLPIFLVSNLIISTLFIVAYSLYSQSNAENNELPQSSTIALTKLAERLEQPIVEALTTYGQNKAKLLLDIASLLNNDFKYTLHRFNANNKAELVYSNNSIVIAPLAVSKYIKEQNTLHHLISSEGQVIAELIIEQKQPLISSSTQNLSMSAYLAAIVALIALFAFAIAFNKYIKKRLHKNTDSLTQELKAITQNDNYQSTLDEQLDGGLETVAQQINLLLKKVSMVLADDQAAQIELKRLQTSLETEVQSRTFELEKQTQKALKASETKTTFLATMSHEIRTPMNGVIGTIDLLRQTELDGAQQRLSTIIRESAFSLLSILDDILDFSKIEAGKLNIDPVPFSIADTLEEVAKVLSSVAKNRHLELDLSIAPDIPNNLMGDSGRVRQVLYNLCSNAIKFTSTNGTTKGKVRISVEVANNTADHFTLRFCVSDNGKGMSQSQLRKIFNPFTQAESSITREFGGTGLGLSICKSLTELMLGTIHVTSHEGIGSEFTVELPFSTAGKTEFAHKNTLNGKHVIIVSSDAERGKVIYRYLSFMGAKITYAHEQQDVEAHQDAKDIIWVVDGIEDMNSISTLLRSLLYSLEDNNQQMVVLSKLDEAVINHKSIFYINASPLCKSNFMLSILVAAGLHKPKQVKKARTMNHYLNSEEALAANRLVLLVEDNLLNQEVLTEQLHILGYSVEVANNGEEGLDMWRKNSYSLILTDLHMPKMSGYDMVEKIREEASLLESIDAQPYIIAVTANALKGERERCLAVGINDFITKPIELNALEDTLKQWNDLYSKQPQQVNSTEKPIMPIDMESANKYINGDDAKIIRFFKMYLEQSQEQIKAINFAVLQSNKAEILSACHQLKSISKTVGANIVADLAQSFEDKCKSDEIKADELIKMRDELEIEYSRAAQFLKEQIRNNDQQDDLI
ncbi:hybrid sensor histidine kinase/response regulator [Pseudoalteromonas sp. S1609]|jgi:signal transduction histidine kinase/DNA-binding response OmpR family regulator|uniref:hybrid sensor histidine kinase/response regulator n=1 Tax=Pseudoalteromonas sp. S1609 TaxID=579505 RepID=UPI00110C0DAA|nr:ATP-binding protein [Pseudoalteromonas sp. S1609]TMP73328.1 hybrid sensor histidine kinase/response regulator [Pseudoalteromonas sp. S1609]